MISPMLHLLLASLTWQMCPGQQPWQLQRDDPAEYQLERMATASRLTECALLADASHQAVMFTQTGSVCSLLSCQLGWSGCRKCRNARNSSLPLLLVRRLDKLGPTCWRTFQHRVDGSVDFYRNWTAYLSQFGQGEDQNYWMGLEAIHQLTRAADRRVRWEMSLWNGSWFWTENSLFAVQGANTGYLAKVGAQEVNRSNVVQNALLNMNQSFTTYDRDQDSSSSNCAVKYHGAWWYSSCHSFNPNGQYFTPPTALNLGAGLGQGLTFSSIGQYPLSHDYSMQKFECMVVDYL